ncbi:lipid IV(A) 4-amino-4-deoxy-L-arabinosyltransferase [Atlantibacter hermannii]|uniref:lipid IV(A) 4-amino-4-deoxy-L-arabinosyltransferase n=1 Tax=Atlantibacter hermannii TaxID=565 RepID=UPI0028B094E5|nr:lipid IV(A) 4-amino-4-deoxy-L-arabinosyltransferase [Atlantibacter hermannii]
MKSTKALIIILMGYVLYYLIPLNTRALWQPDETRYAEISREMLASGDWIVPHFFGLRYFEKPIAGYWINNIGQWLFGHNNFAVRFGSVLSITLSALLIAWLAWRMWSDKRTMLLAPVIYLTSFLVYGVGTYAVLDPIVTMWLTAAMCLFWMATQATSNEKKILSYALLGVVCGFGVMTKGFLALAIPVIAALPWIIFVRQWKDILTFGGLSIVTATLTVLPWGIAIAQREPDFWHYFFWVEHIQRFANEDAQHKAPFWYYIPLFLTGFLPWVGLLPGAIQSGWKNRHEQPALFYLLCWTLMPLLFFSIAKGKLPTYILPCFAPLALLTARYGLYACSTTVYIINARINMAFGILTALFVLLILAPWSIASNPLFASFEIFSLSFGLLIFLLWAAFGYLSSREPKRLWTLAALCPLGMALLISQAIPESIIDTKQPQHFINTVRTSLLSSKYILTNNPGIAASVAWELERTNISFYDQAGEMKYGLQYPEAAGRFIRGDDFPGWLKEFNHNGDVALILLLSENENLDFKALPKPDYMLMEGRLTLLCYKKKK